MYGMRRLKRLSAEVICDSLSMELELADFFIIFGFVVVRKLFDDTVMDAVGSISNTEIK